MNEQKSLRNWLYRALPAFVFGISLLLSWVAAYFVAMNLLDSDASSELVLAKLLAQQNKLLTADWFYSSELRVTSTNLVFAPLFNIFSDWHTVRFVGIVILQTTLAASYYYLCRQMRVSLKAFFWSASFLVLPFSVAYGRIVLYHTYYLPFVVISFLLTGLFLASSRAVSAPGKWPSKAIPISLMLSLSFLAGLNGIRSLMIIMVPLLLSALIQAPHIGACSHEGSAKPLLSQWGSVGLAFAVCCLGGAGYLVNSLYFAKIFSFEQYNAFTLGFASADRVMAVLLGYVSQYGFQTERLLLSFDGLLAVGGLFVACYLACRGFRALRAHSVPPGTATGFVQILFPVAILTLSAVFLLSSGPSFYLLYFIPVAVWAIPLLATWIDSSASVQRLLLLLVCALIYGNGLYNLCFFINPQNEAVTYQGLSREETHTVERLRDVVDFLRDEEYTLGYAQFWQSNVVVEMSNGEIPMVTIALSPGSPEIAYYDWLNNRGYRERSFVAEQKVFLLLERNAEWEFFMNLPVSDSATLEYEDEFYMVYSFESPLDLVDEIEARMPSAS